MKKKVRYEFSKDDITYLKNPGLINPCKKCGARIDGSCCGCPDGWAFDKAIKTTDKDLMELGVKVHNLLDDVAKYKSSWEGLKNRASEIEDIVGTENFKEIMGGSIDEVLI